MIYYRESSWRHNECFIIIMNDEYHMFLKEESTDWAYYSDKKLSKLTADDLYRVFECKIELSHENKKNLKDAFCSCSPPITPVLIAKFRISLESDTS